MKEWEERKKRRAARRVRRTGITRGGRILRNLLLSLLLVLPLWWLAEFHRLERENLVPRGGIFFSATPLPWKQGVTQVNLGGEMYSLHEGAWVVGASRNWAEVMGGDGFRIYPRGEGPDVVPMSLGYLLIARVKDGRADQELVVPLLLLDAPEEAVRAELEMEIPWEGVLYHREGSGTRQRSGAWLFGMEPPDNKENGSVWGGSWYEGASWTLRTWGADGAPLEELQGTVPSAF